MIRCAERRVHQPTFRRDGRGNRHPRSRTCSSRRPPSGTAILVPPPRGYESIRFLSLSLCLPAFLASDDSSGILKSRTHTDARLRLRFPMARPRAFRMLFWGEEEGDGFRSIVETEMFSTWNLFCGLAYKRDDGQSREISSREKKTNNFLVYRISSLSFSFFCFSNSETREI